MASRCGSARTEKCSTHLSRGWKQHSWGKQPIKARGAPGAGPTTLRQLCRYAAGHVRKTDLYSVKPLLLGFCYMQFYVIKPSALTRMFRYSSVAAGRGHSRWELDNTVMAACRTSPWWRPGFSLKCFSPNLLFGFSFPSACLAIYICLYAWWLSSWELQSGSFVLHISSTTYHPALGRSCHFYALCFPPSWNGDNPMFIFSGYHRIKLRQCQV